MNKRIIKCFVQIRNLVQVVIAIKEWSRRAKVGITYGEVVVQRVHSRSCYIGVSLQIKSRIKKNRFSHKPISWRSKEVPQGLQ